MAFIKEHEKDCVEFLNKPYTDVHKWLDQYENMFHVGFFGEYHRTFLHNSYGLTCIKSIFGCESEKAARIHLIRDYLHSPINKRDVDFYIDGRGFNIMMKRLNDPNDLIVDPDVCRTWLKKGFSLVSLAYQ